MTCSTLDRTDLLCCTINKGGCYGRPTANSCGGVWCLLGPDRQLLWLTMHNSDGFHTTMAGPVADDPDQHDQASCVFLLYVMSGLSLHGTNVATRSASKLSYNVLPLADIQQDQDNGQTCHTDNSFLCAPAKPLMCSVHVSRLPKAIRTLPG